MKLHKQLSLIYGNYIKRQLRQILLPNVTGAQPVKLVNVKWPRL